MAKIQQLFRPSNVAKTMLFESAIVTMIMGALTGVAIERTWSHINDMEGVEIQQTVAALNASLHSRSAEIIVRDLHGELARLSRENPIELLEKKPRNYLGVYYNPDIKTLPLGHWYYDKGDNSLVYLLNKENLVSAEVPKMLKFKVKLLRLPKNPAKPSGAPYSEGVVLEQVQ